MDIRAVCLTGTVLYGVDIEEAPRGFSLTKYH